jgi:hypothetical protein
VRIEEKSRERRRPRIGRLKGSTRAKAKECLLEKRRGPEKNDCSGRGRLKQRNGEKELIIAEEKRRVWSSRWRGGGRRRRSKGVTERQRLRLRSAGATSLSESRVVGERWHSSGNWEMRGAGIVEPPAQ